MALHVSLPSTRQRCGGEYGQPNSRKNPRSAVSFSRCVIRNNKTFLQRFVIYIGAAGLNPRPVAAATAPQPQLVTIGLVGFELTVCRRGDRSPTAVG
jgi:hypothetical protein